VIRLVHRCADSIRRTRGTRLANAVLIGVALATLACSEREQPERPAFERAQQKLEESFAKGKAGAEKAWASALARWDELRPRAERAAASLEQRMQKLMNDSEALQRLPPDVLQRMKTRLDALRAKLDEAQAEHEKGNADLAVEKMDEVQRESAAAEELLVERPDQPVAAQPTLPGS
jgi:chromosome segregation ATPase